MTIGQALRWAQNELDEISGEDATADARAFVCCSARIEPEAVLMRLGSPMQGRDMKFLQQMVARRKHREPTQYIVGFTHFLGLKILCDPRALIPRFETELLALEAQQVARANGLSTALDLCAGSGCVAVALALAKLKVAAADMSEDALLLAEENAKLHNVDISFHQGNLFEAFEEPTAFDMIVSNPPYVRSAELDWLPEEICGHEPHMALDGGDDGLSFYRKIVKQAPDWLNPGGCLLFEVGDGQAADVRDMMGESFEEIATNIDMRGIERIVKGKRKD